MKSLDGGVVAEVVEESIDCVVSVELDDSVPSSAAAIGTMAMINARPRISVRKQTTSALDVGGRTI